MKAENLLSIVKVMERKKGKVVTCAKIKYLALKMMEEHLKHF